MKEDISHSGVWVIAAIMIVVASWVLYPCLAPMTWREWAGAGVVQAFIIALCVEMYGFPPTMYLLVRFFGLDRTNLNANLWSSLIGLGELVLLNARDSWGPSEADALIAADGGWHNPRPEETK
jgi:uncharacterized membrane protein (DUF4010 family)